MNVFLHMFIFQRRQFPNRVDWTNENVSFGAGNYECLLKNVARFGHMKCMFDKVNYIFQGFGSLVSLRLQKDGRTKSK